MSRECAAISSSVSRRTPFPPRLLRMAKAAAADDDVTHFTEFRARHRGRKPRGRRPQFGKITARVRESGEPRREDEGGRGHAPTPPQLPPLRVQGVEEMPDRDADDDDEPDDHEVPA